MNTDERPWREHIDGLRDGDPIATKKFCEEYGPALQAVAAKHLSPDLRRRVGADDVVQSACRTFLRRAQVGEFQLADSESLWRLLCAITLTKVKEQARFHQRRRRDVGQEIPLQAGSGDGSVLHPAASGPTPAEAAEFADHFQQLIASLDEEERRIVDLKLQEYTNEEVAERLNSSERTVRRILKRVQTRLERAFQTA